MRLFIATSFPPEVIRELNGRVANVRTRLPSASWVKPDSMHLTFAFLGEQEESLVERVSKPLQSAMATIPKFEATLSGCGFFPNARRPRVGWIGLHPEENFIDAAEEVRKVVTANGVELDRSEFRPHLTLMRIRDNWPPASIELFSKTFHDFKSVPFTVDCVNLYSSQLHPSGAVHTVLRDFRLK